MVYISLVARNTALRVAIVQSEKEHQEIARLAKIHPARLSQIISNKVTASESERLRLAGVLQRTVSEIFPEAMAS